jgi:FAD/FMN-containing dehydrogenase
MKAPALFCDAECSDCARRGELVNDEHSQLNATFVDRVIRPRSLAELMRAVERANAEGIPIIASGSRHAMGGQQFCAQGWVLDLRALRRVLAFDAERGLIEIEAGIEWPDLIDTLLAAQQHRSDAWSIVQKQTGADRLTIGGAVSANIHGRGLTLRPFEQDIAALTLIDGSGVLRRCSRHQNTELFRLVIGGYGLFGVIYSVQLRLARRYPVRRVVRLVRSEELMDAFSARIAEGFTYGDWQFAIDPASPDFLRLGVFSCYAPLPRKTAIPHDQRILSGSDWRDLLRLAHVSPSRAFERYSAHYLATSGQVYWSDLHQLSPYVADYHAEVDRCTGACVRGSEMITELYLPRHRLETFLTSVRADFRAAAVQPIYGTVRLIERDQISFLPWAREPWACVIFNLHVDREPAAIARAGETFRGLIDRARESGGSYYLTYHPWATPIQVRACHPRFAQFLAAKRGYDPDERFVSNWYRRYRDGGAGTRRVNVLANEEVPV